MPRWLWPLALTVGALVACQTPPAGSATQTVPAAAATPTTAVAAPATPAAASSAATVGVQSPAVAGASPALVKPSAAAVTPSPVAAVQPPSTSASRVDVLNAAAAAYQAGDPAAAAALYERVINTPPSASEGTTAAVISDFAEFEAMLSLLAASREEDARAHLQDLQSRDPSAPLPRLAAQVWDQYGMTGQLRGACAQLQPQLGQVSAVLIGLQAAGVKIDAQTVCSVPSRLQ